MRQKEKMNQMTLEEKAAFLSGKNEWQTRDIPRLDIPSIFLADGPHGIRKQEGNGDHLGLNPSIPATCFPTAATIANSWNEELGEEIGRALGEEALALGVDVLLGPGLNMKRSLLCGRNFEYFSEDPYLAGKMAASYIRGIQCQGVYACPKHFAVNNQELRRMAMNSVLDERTLREIYLTGFEIAVKEAKPGAIMTSYNQVNGIYANENRHLLEEILRKDWGYDGFVVTDWGGSNDHIEGVKAGSDLEMPTSGFDSARQIIKAIKENVLTEGELNACVERLLHAVMSLEGEKKKKKKKKKIYDEVGHHELAKKAAAESIVLLKNDDKILPLKEKMRVAVLGDFAFEPRYQGAGSSMVNATFIETIAKKIVEYDLHITGMCRGFKRNGKQDDALKKEALKLVEDSDVVIYCMGLDEMSEAEGQDREHMKIHENQIALLKALYEKNPNIVGVLSAGAVVEMSWKKYCKAILHGYLCGQAGAGAMLDILTGKVNPSGKLAETYPMEYAHTPAYHYFPSAMRNAEYRESIFIGYRYYDTVDVKVVYPFGYGLSYTNFEYSDLKIGKEGAAFIIKNVGEYDGAEITQLYVGLPGGNVFRPKKELKGFRKVFLKSGESKEVTIPFDDKTFRYWDINSKQWEVEGGEYQIMIGANIADIRLQENLVLKGTTEIFPYQKEKMPSYFNGRIQKVSDMEFSELLGYPIPCGVWSGQIGINDAVCQMYYAKSLFARFLYKLLTYIKEKNEAKGKQDLNILFIYNIPFRAIAKMTGGMVSIEMAEGMVRVVNGHFLSGIKQIIGGFISNRRENVEYEKQLLESKAKVKICGQKGECGNE
ncbi:glycoside hydrolase family 3 C-terminal domain-containing protein [Lachnospiraceae bacterium 29-91]